MSNPELRLRVAREAYAAGAIDLDTLESFTANMLADPVAPLPPDLRAFWVEDLGRRNDRLGVLIEQQSARLAKARSRALGTDRAS